MVPVLSNTMLFTCSTNNHLSPIWLHKLWQNPSGERLVLETEHKAWFTNLVSSLKWLTTFDQNAIRGSDTGAHHHCGRCGQTQSAWTRDGQHSDCETECHFKYCFVFVSPTILKCKRLHNSDFSQIERRKVRSTRNLQISFVDLVKTNVKKSKANDLQTNSTYGIVGVNKADVHVSDDDPGDERQWREDNDAGNEVSGDLIRQCLDRRLWRLRLFDEFNDLRERAVGADVRGAHDQRAVLVDGAANHVGTWVKKVAPTWNLTSDFECFPSVMNRVFFLYVPRKNVNRVCFSLLFAQARVSPVFFSTGIASPVMSDSSHVDEPSTIRPSTGIFSPGTTCTENPSWFLSISKAERNVPGGGGVEKSNTAIYPQKIASLDQLDLESLFSGCISFLVVFYQRRFRCLQRHQFG